MMRLFDPEPYTTGRPAEDRARGPRPPVARPSVVLGQDGWLLAERLKKVETHIGVTKNRVTGAVRTACDKMVVPLTFEPGLTVDGCLACIEAKRKETE